jgi:TolB-like protein/Tfp pilus assembly protein PilF
MATEATHDACENCGVTLRRNSVRGLCPACLLTTAIEEGDLEVFASGSRIQDYELLNEVARGGMGIVYRARQRAPSRIVALKMILPTHVGSADAMSRFRVETEAAASLEHEGILPIYAVGEHDGAPFYSMKFAEGGTLADRLGEYRARPREAAALIAEVARAVAYAHQHRILHRDLKPANVLFDGEGRPHVSDFGLAKWLARESDLTQSFAMLGTPFYMAPEQAVSSDLVTEAADIYSLGAILYHLLTGDPPFTGDTPMEVLRQAENQPAPRPRLTNRSVPTDLETICLKCLEKDPAWRYSSAPALADDLERFCAGHTIQARRAGPFKRAGKWVQRNPTITVLAATLIALTAGAWSVVWKNNLAAQPPMTTGIAVLPFENLSEQKEDGPFVDGLQDDILTKLAKIADLIVMSRASVMESRGDGNLRKIGEALRVSHVLEGSARRDGKRFHMNAQLIDTRSDTHLWAEQYDRDLNELFAVQTEIAENVARQLRAKMSAEEKLSIEQKPTNDLLAFDLYSRANEITLNTNSDLLDFPQAIELLNQAVARDPSFFEAYCQLASAHDALYFNNIDRTPARLELAKNAIRGAFRVHPGAGEAHLAQAEHLYRGYKDYEGALAELEVARQTLPNHVRIFQLAGYIQRRQGRWDEAGQNFERAVELDPHNVDTLRWLADHNEAFGRNTESMNWLKRMVAVAKPDDAFAQLAIPDWEFRVNADTSPLHRAIDSIRTNNLGAISAWVAAQWLDNTLAERDPTAANEALAVNRGDGLMGMQNDSNCAYMEGVIARMAHDETRAQSAFNTARIEQEKIVRKQPEFAHAWSALGLIDACLGRKEDALRESQHAMELLPIERDAVFGRFIVSDLAVIAAWVGEKDLACQQLEALCGPPRFVNYGSLKLMPWWDPLRGYPPFEKILNSLAPKETNTK